MNTLLITSLLATLISANSFVISSDPVPFGKAAEACQANGWTLADLSAKSAEDASDILYKSGVEAVWIGAFDNIKEPNGGLAFHLPATAKYGFITSAPIHDQDRATFPALCVATSTPKSHVLGFKPEECKKSDHKEKVTKKFDTSESWTSTHVSEEMKTRVPKKKHRRVYKKPVSSSLSSISSETTESYSSTSYSTLKIIRPHKRHHYRREVKVKEQVKPKKTRNEIHDKTKAKKFVQKRQQRKYSSSTASYSESESYLRSLSKSSKGSSRHSYSRRKDHGKQEKKERKEKKHYLFDEKEMESGAPPRSRASMQPGREMRLQKRAFSSESESSKDQLRRERRVPQPKQQPLTTTATSTTTTRRSTKTPQQFNKTQRNPTQRCEQRPVKCPLQSQPQTRREKPRECQQYRRQQERHYQRGIKFPSYSSECKEKGSDLHWPYKMKKVYGKCGRGVCQISIYSSTPSSFSSSSPSSSSSSDLHHRRRHHGKGKCEIRVRQNEDCRRFEKHSSHRPHRKHRHYSPSSSSSITSSTSEEIKRLERRTCRRATVRPVYSSKTPTSSTRPYQPEPVVLQKKTVRCRRG
jgi:hypothetical protein